jgi:ABC-type transporter Mla maintaining outer membrane lipid asymmetry permease subunit MlaE
MDTDSRDSSGRQQQLKWMNLSTLQGKVFAVVFVSQIAALPSSLLFLGIEYFQIEGESLGQRFHHFTGPSDVLVYWVKCWVVATVIFAFLAYRGVRKAVNKQNQNKQE